VGGDELGLSVHIFDGCCSIPIGGIRNKTDAPADKQKGSGGNRQEMGKKNGRRGGEGVGVWMVEWGPSSN
jgi:hypothetical protein